MIDSRLTMANQVGQLRLITRSLSVDAVKAVTQAFIMCRLDYCNWLLFGITDELLQRLQSVQNAAARLVSGAKRLDHITPVLRQLYWLQTCGVQCGGLDVQGCPRASTVVPGR